MLNVWDTAGQERFRTITMAYYRGANGAIICYDCTNRQTLTNAAQWISDFRDKCAVGAPILLIACKFDLQEENSTENN